MTSGFKLIQPLLLLLILGALGLYAVAFRNRTRDRAMLVLFGLIGAYAVLRPDDLSRLAQFVGVGRGTDLLLYLALMAGVFVAMMLSGRLRELERRHTELVRYLAIEGAEGPSESPPGR